MNLAKHHRAVVSAFSPRIALPGVALALYSVAALPAIYKCKDANGNVVYSEAKCSSNTNDITPDIIRILPINGGGQSQDTPRRGASRRAPPASSGGGAVPPL